MTTHLPDRITHDQAAAACKALGLDPRQVAELRLDALDGAFVKVFVCDSEGRKMVQDDDALTATVRIPFGSEAGPPK